MTAAQKRERAALIREGERSQAIANFYEANQPPAWVQQELAALQEQADQNGWEAE